MIAPSITSVRRDRVLRADHPIHVARLIHNPVDYSPRPASFRGSTMPQLGTTPRMYFINEQPSYQKILEKEIIRISLLESILSAALDKNDLSIQRR